MRIKLYRTMGIINSITKRFYIAGITLILAGACTVVNAQVLKDTTTFRLMKKGVDCIYNLQFDQAREIYRKVVEIYPQHPIIHVYKGLITYWENYPLIPASKERAAFESEMQYAMDLCEKKPDHEKDPEYLLSHIGARGLLLLYYADNDLTGDVIKVASSTYQYVKQSFNHTHTYADFYFITGLYNYYREAYPESHPVYKPVAMLFPKGDKIRGLKELQIASKDAVVLKAEAFSFLSGIYISYENNFQQAYQFSKALHELYPRNVQYTAGYIKNLLLVKRYAEAENLIRKSREQGRNQYFMAQLSILNGIVQEKKYINLKQAQQEYTRGIKDIEVYGTFGNEFAAYGYFGLSRISQDKHQKKSFRKKAMELAAFENVNFDK